MDQHFGWSALAANAHVWGRTSDIACLSKNMVFFVTFRSTFSVSALNSLINMSPFTPAVDASVIRLCLAFATSASIDPLFAGGASCRVVRRIMRTSGRHSPLPPERTLRWRTCLWTTGGKL